VSVFKSAIPVICSAKTSCPVTGKEAGTGKFFATVIRLAVLATLWLAQTPAAAPGADNALTREELAMRLVSEARVPDLVAYAYRENPALQEHRQAWRAAVERYRVATGYPDPQLTVTYFPDPIETRLGPQDWNAALSQPIPFPGKLTQAGRVVATDAEIARLRLDQAARELTASVRESFYELYYIRTGREVVARNEELLAHLRKVGETAYAEDRAALMDMVKAQSQSGQLRYDALLLEELEGTERTRLNGLLNRPPDAAIGPLRPEPFAPLLHPLEALYTLAETHQETLRIAGLGVARADEQVKLARYQSLPDFRVGLFYAAIGSPDVAMKPDNAGDDAVGVQFGLSLPLWFGKSRGRMDQARAERARAQAARQTHLNDIRTRIHATYFKMKNARRLVALYQNELLPQATRAMATAETWFRQGQSSFSDFIETQSVVYNFQLSLARARADYGKVMARLEQLVGHPLTGRPGNDDGQGAP
jgi:outer membrane protein TolC